jgi:phosphoribosylglycinamide formyltransferase 1
MSDTQRKLRVGVLISGRGSNMQALVEAALQPGFPAEIVLVLSNKLDAAGLAFANDKGIATAAVSHKGYPDRESFDRAMHAILVEHDIEFLCLAGFMRLLSGWFCTQWAGRMINIHPALLPSYRGLHTHERALADGVAIHGCTVHFVTEEMDVGVIVGQAAVPVYADDTPDRLAARVLAKEHRLYPACLERIVQRQLNRPANGQSLSEEGLVVIR